jgi:hypothetical protein
MALDANQRVLLASLDALNDIRNQKHYGPIPCEIDEKTYGPPPL